MAHRLEQRQTQKVRARRRVFLWSRVGTIPILVMAMILPHIMKIPDKKIHFLGYTVHYLVASHGVVDLGHAGPVLGAGAEFYKMA